MHVSDGAKRAKGTRMVQLSVRAGHPWDGWMSLTEGRESPMRGGLKRDIQSRGLVTGR